MLLESHPIGPIPLDEVRVIEHEIGQIACQHLLHAPKGVLGVIGRRRPVESSQARFEVRLAYPVELATPSPAKTAVVVREGGIAGVQPEDIHVVLALCRTGQQ